MIEDALCEAGHFGQKTGKGYFRYEAGSRTPLPDPEVERIILDASARLGHRPPARSRQEEIVERMIFPMINEGARILEEGIAARPGDIDVIWVYGYGWPVWRGGPMYYADQLGLAHVRDRLTLYAERSGDETLRPAVRIRRLAAEGRGFRLAPLTPISSIQGVRRIMDLRFTAEELAFRDEVRAFFRAESAGEHSRPSWSRARSSPRTTSSPGSASSTKRAGRSPTGRSNGAAPAGPRFSNTSSRKSCS